MSEMKQALARFHVSRETQERLEALVAVLAKWNPKINLVAKGTLSEVWTRHIADSLQIFDIAPETARSWIDLGSGGGFPGLPVAALAAERNPDLALTLALARQSARHGKYQWPTTAAPFHPRTLLNMGECFSRLPLRAPPAGAINHGSRITAGPSP